LHVSAEEVLVNGLASINLFVGAWLIFTSWIVPGGIATGPRTWNGALSGVLLIVLAGWTVAGGAHVRVPLWLQAAVGGWLILAPFLLGFSPWNQVLCGLMAISATLLTVAPLPEL
jgi:hypothetical protein